MAIEEFEVRPVSEDLLLTYDEDSIRLWCLSSGALLQDVQAPVQDSVSEAQGTRPVISHL